MSIQCFIIDHHPLNLKIFESYIHKTPLFEFLGSVASCQAYYDSSVRSDILLINIDSMTEEKPESFKHLNQILIFMTDRPYDQSDIMKLDRNYENTGFLALPATYKVFIQEVERLIK